MKIIGLRYLNALQNRYLISLVNNYVKLCKPDQVTVLKGTESGLVYIRKTAIKNGEEFPLKTAGHTCHFDGMFDQGRDKAQTKVLLPKGQTIGQHINTGDRKECLAEMKKLLNNSMTGKEMFIAFYCLGPVNSPFSIPALQITDSAYVVHSENLLYRPGYEEFKKLKNKKGFFSFIHSSGELEKNLISMKSTVSTATGGSKEGSQTKLHLAHAQKLNNNKTAIEAQFRTPERQDPLCFSTSKNHSQKRIYIDLMANRVFSVNTQYAGNSVGLKKLALRLAIKKSHQSNWLCEHMLIIGVKPAGKKRTTYFTGAYPSACGKTSTAMIPGQTIIGDDIAYLKPGKDGRVYSVNVEKGIFGIISDINPYDDPVISKVLTDTRELIFSNVLIQDKKPYWLGMGGDLPTTGLNYSGIWHQGKKDPEGNEIKPAHPNARYTLEITGLPNADPHLNDPQGVPIDGIIYGGRDSDTSPPVVESFNWNHGVFMGAAVESETTAAVIGKTGVRMHNPMANLDFMVVPLPLYIENHLKFGANLKHLPLIFTVNYFLKENGQFLSEKVDKKIWLMWMEGRIHNEFEAIETPIGYIPHYQDLKGLFREIFRRDYSKETYDIQFQIRTGKLLEKLDRIEDIFKQEKGIPDMMFHLIDEQRKRLKK